MRIRGAETPRPLNIQPLEVAEMSTEILTQSELISLLQYEPTTGFFKWRKAKRGIAAWTIAGYTNAGGYIVIRIEGKNHYAHRLAVLYMTGEWPPFQVDHDDHVRSNNIWSNLNLATSATNHKNQSMYKRNTSGAMGVYWAKNENKWMAGIGLNGKSIHGGYFVKFSDAVTRRKELEVEHDFHKNHGK